MQGSTCQVERVPSRESRTYSLILCFVCIAECQKISSFTRLHFGAYTAEAGASRETVQLCLFDRSVSKALARRPTDGTVSADHRIAQNQRAALGCRVQVAFDYVELQSASRGIVLDGGTGSCFLFQR